MELSLGDYKMCSVAPSKLAAAALALSMRILDDGSKLSEVWSTTLSHYTRYYKYTNYLEFNYFI